MITRYGLLIPFACILSLAATGCDDDPASPPDEPELVVIPNTNTVLIGQTIQFRAESFGEPAIVEWSESSPAITLVTSNTTGVIRGVEAGQAVLTARLVSDNTIRATADVIVEPQDIESVEVFPAELTLNLNERFTLGANVIGATGIVGDVEWESGDTNIASVNDDGRVEGRQIGRTLITATAVGDPAKKGFCLVEVVAGG